MSSLSAFLLTQQKYELRCRLKRAGSFELTPVVESEIVDERRVEEQAIEPVEEAAVAWEYLRGVLRLRASLQSALRQVADDAEHVHHGGERERRDERQFAEEPVVRERGQQKARGHPAHSALPGLPRTDVRRELVSAEKATRVVRARVRTHQHE